MSRVRLDQDIKPLSEFRANVSRIIDRIRTTKRPVILTQRGRGAAVVLDVSEYERLLEEVETLRDIRLGERQLRQGRGVPHDAARTRVVAALRR